MKKCLFFVVFLGLMSIPSLAKNRHGNLDKYIQSECEEYEAEEDEREQAGRVVPSECYEDSWSIEDSHFYSDGESEQTSHNNEQMSEGSDEDESDCSQSEGEEYDQEPLIFEEDDCSEPTPCTMDFGQSKSGRKQYSKAKPEISIVSIEKQLAELKYDKGSRRYKELYRLYSNFMRNLEQPATIMPKSRNCSLKYTKKNRCAIRIFRMNTELNNDTERVQEVSQNEIIIPGDNPDQQRIHINHRQLWSGDFSANKNPRRK